jgi:hypothetical protein
MIAEFFLQGKVTELIGIFKKGTTEQKARAVDILGAIDVVNASRYKQDRHEQSVCGCRCGHP